MSGALNSECHGIRGTCQHEVREADFMASVNAIPLRKPIKPHAVFGKLAADYSKAEGVQGCKDKFLAGQRGNSIKDMTNAAEEYFALLQQSSYSQEVLSDARQLTEATAKGPWPKVRTCATHDLDSTRLDFAAQAIWQVTSPEGAEESTDADAIEAMQASARRGGYKLAWMEVLYRGRGESNEEGVGPFIMPLLRMPISYREIWAAFKRQEFRWAHDNFTRQGLAISVNLFPSDFLDSNIVNCLFELHEDDRVAFRLLHVELLEYEDVNEDVVAAILIVNGQTGLLLAKDDMDAETFANPLKRRRLIQLHTALRGCLTVWKLDSDIVCGALNVPLVPCCFSRFKNPHDTEVRSKRQYREAWAIGMPDEERQFPFPVHILNSEHFAQEIKTRYSCKLDAIEQAADVVEGFLEVAFALRFEVDIVAEVSVYANDFHRQLHHPIFGPFVKALLAFSKRGRLFIQGSMCGARAMSDAIVPHLVESPTKDASNTMKALLADRQHSSFAGAEKDYHITEDFSVYDHSDFNGARIRVESAWAKGCQSITV